MCSTSNDDTKSKGVETMTSSIDDKSPSGITTYLDKADFDVLADRALKLLEDCQCGNQKASSCKSGFNECEQVFIGIAGTPGSGKSYIAEQIAKTIQERNPNGDPENPECVVIGMDGYHLTRSQLKDKAEAGEWFEVEDMEGHVEEKQMSFEDLMTRRGAAFTYDPAAFIRDLKKVKKEGQGSFPVYDRSQHDPVADGIRVERYHKIILVEGLYLLCLHDPDWAPLDDLWDDRWYIDVSEKETKQRLVKRHLKNWTDDKTQRWGGDDEEAAARKAEANDLINAACIRKMSRDKAKLIVSNEDIPEDDSKNPDVEAAS